MAIKFTNFARGLLSVGITSVDTSITLSAGYGALFPSLTVGDYFYATLENAALQREIVKVTARATDTLTVVRGQDGTTATAWSAGDSLSLRFNAAALNEVLGSIVHQSGAELLVGSVAGTNTITGTLSPAITSYTAGQSFKFVAAGANTGAVTINLNGLGAKAITKSGATALSSGDIASGAVVSITYDGTQFQMAPDSSAAVDALKDVAANSQSTSYTLALTDRGKSIDFTGAAGQTITVPANGTVAFPVGAVVTITNTTTNNLLISINTDTLRQAGTANVGTRTLGQYGVATLRKVASTTWIIGGSGLS